MELVARVAVEADAISPLALLKHPLTRLGWPREEITTRTAALEVLALRQPWFAGGLEGLLPALDRAGETGEGARDLVARLKEALAPLTQSRMAARSSTRSRAPIGVLPCGSLHLSRKTRSGTGVLAR